MSLNSVLMFNHLADRLADVARVGHWLQAEPANEGGQTWWLWLLLFIILILLVWWLLQRESRYSSVESTAPVAAAPVKSTVIPAAPVTAASIPRLNTSPLAPAAATPVIPPVATHVPETVVENLTKIEGIGPQINGVLHAAGIKTFADLSKAEVGQLRQILVGVGMKVNDPTTWPEQAGLAATGDWAGLRKLQEQLNGGRRV